MTDDILRSIEKVKKRDLSLNADKIFETEIVPLLPKLKSWSRAERRLDIDELVQRTTISVYKWLRTGSRPRNTQAFLRKAFSFVVLDMARERDKDYGKDSERGREKDRGDSRYAGRPRCWEISATR